MSPEDTYRQTTPKSRALHQTALRAMPGGTTRTTTYFEPYPLYIERGRGCHIWDVDGTERLDALGNYSALILGHAHPKIVEAVHRQIALGTAFAAANPIEVELAGILCERIPSVELVRFCNSGTEATMFAMRLARAFTGRPRVARIEGGYHGTHDYAEVSSHPALESAGPAKSPVAQPDSIGTPDWVLEETVVLPFNDLAAAEGILRQHASQLAGIIVEPVIGGGGVIAATPAFLEGLRRLATELGALLIFDEVISLRLSPGGAQQIYGVMPDLTTMGKIIGGGLPVAAFGGRADVMQLMDPRNEPHLAQGGTFNGNPLGMAAGLAALRELTPDVYEHLNRQGARVGDHLREIFAAHDLGVQVNAVGSLIAIHFTDRPVTDYRSKATSDRARTREFFLGMVNNGVLMAPRLMAALSTPMEEADIQQLLDAAERVVSNQLAALRARQDTG